MRRTINSTGRQRIERGDINLSLSGPEDGPRKFDLILGLSEYELPADARVFVEASRNTTWARFDFGTVGALTPPTDRTLTDFGSAQGTTFRIKVVEAAAQDATATSRILAQADGVPSGDPDADGPAQSMLAIDWNESPMGDELWRVEVGETVILRVNRAMLRPQPWTALTESPSFRAIALPAILRQVLTDAVLFGDEEDPTQGPLGAWVKYAESTLGAGTLPAVPVGERRVRDGVEGWVNRAVEAFCARRNTRASAVEARLTEGGTP